jgi:two-component system response regulator FixJ
MKEGAIDFIEKPFDREKLLDAVRRAFSVLADADSRRDMVTAAQIQIAALTSREREVIAGLACGYPNKTIAFDLGISPRTVEVHRANLMAKLEVTNFADALRIAFAAGLGNGLEWREDHKNGGKSAQVGSSPGSQDEANDQECPALHQEIHAEEQPHHPSHVGGPAQ